MSYATLQNLLDRGYSQELVELTDTTNSPPTTIDDTKVQDALDDATAEINSYITAANVPTPLNPVPRVIVNRCVEIARYRLWRDRASEKVAQDYKDAVAWLKMLADGAVQLGDNVAPTEQTEQVTPVLQTQSGENAITGARVFTKRSLRGF